MTSFLRQTSKIVTDDAMYHDGTVTCVHMWHARERESHDIEILQLQEDSDFLRAASVGFDSSAFTSRKGAEIGADRATVRRGL